MVIDNTAVLSVSMLSPFVSLAAAWGMWKARVQALEKTVDKVEARTLITDENQRQLNEIFVRMTQFLSVLTPVQQNIIDIQSDIKKILLLINEGSRRENPPNR